MSFGVFAINEFEFEFTVFQMNEFEFEFEFIVFEINEFEFEFEFHGRRKNEFEFIVFEINEFEFEFEFHQIQSLNLSLRMSFKIQRILICFFNEMR